MKNSLKSATINATFWSAIEQVGTKGLSTVFMLIVARYLTAEDFGVFAAASLVTAFSGIIAHFGLDTVIVQRKTISVEDLSTGFWLTFLASLLIAFFIVGLSEIFAGFFDSPEVAHLLPFLAAGMVLSTASIMVTSLLRRELNMKAIARRALLANLISAVFALPFIIKGYGAWGLVVQSVGGSGLTLLLTVLLVGWPVRFTFGIKTALEMLRFGAPVTGANLMGRYNRESPKFFVGFFLGIEALGVFTMAMRVMMLLLQVVGVTLSKVTLPVLSQINRDNPERMAGIYLRLVRFAGVFILPVFLLVIVMGDPVVETLLGPTWIEIVPIMVFLCAAGLMTNFNYINGSTLVALGKPQARFKFSSLRAIIGTILLLAATPFGVVAAGAAFFLRGVIVEPMQLLYLLRVLGVSVSRYLKQVQGSAFAALVMVLTATGVQILMADQPALLLLAIALPVAMASYGGALIIFDKSFIAELRALGSKRGTKT